MRLLHEIAVFITVKSEVIISLFETVRLSVSISLRNLYNSLNSMKENIMWYQITVELHLLECYQAMPVDAISEEDWLILTFTKIIAFRLVI